MYKRQSKNFAELVEGALEAGALGAEVHADAAGVAEEGSVGEEETDVFSGLDGIFVFECGAVDPGEVGGLDVRDFGGGELFSEGGGEEVAVCAEVGEEALTPGFAVFVGCFGGVVGDAVNLGEGVAFCGVEAAADGVVRDDGEGVAEAGDVVGFAGGEEGDGAVAEGIGKVEGGEVRCFFFVEDEVAVDLVRDEDEVVLFAEGGELDNFFFGEGAAEGILGIAEEEEFRLRGDCAFEGVPVEGPVGIALDVIDAEEFHGGVIVNAEEGWVNGSAGEEGIAGFSEGARGEGESGDEAAEVDDLFFRGSVSDAVLQVALEGFDKRGVGDSVAEDAVVNALADGGDDFGWRGEIHVGNPERVEVRAAIPLE